jgi:hypothetical protein
MNDRIDEVAKELGEVTQGTRATFGSLSRNQLNWKPGPNRWSIAQCLDHLITINSLYFRLLESIGTGAAKPTLWERYSPLSGTLGKLLIKTSSPEYPKKVKTSPKAEPSTSEIDLGILDRFAQHQGVLIGHLRSIPFDIDRERTIVTSPLLHWATYSLDDCITILVAHEKRHFQQAQRVMEAEAFPSPA